MATTNWRDAVTQLLRGVHWAGNKWGERLTGLLALYHDHASFGAGEARRAPWILEDSSPDDALPLAGRDRNMPRYPYETSDQYRARLVGAWDAWDLAGTRQVLIDQFDALGLTIQIYDQGEWDRAPSDHPVTGTFWWSKFTIFVEAGTFDPPVKFGDAGVTFGDGHLFGVDGDPAIITAVRNILRKFKAGHEVCLEVIGGTNGITFADGTLFGDVGATFGGEAIVFSAV